MLNRFKGGGQKGFTLLELLIVIVIIGILAVLIIPNLASGPARGRDSQRKSDLRNIKTALESYYNDNSAYPAAASWTTDLQGGPPYMKAVPTDPKTKAAYTYTPAPSGGPYTSYTLTVNLENTSDKDSTNGVYTVSSAQ